MKPTANGTKTEARGRLAQLLRGTRDTGRSIEFPGTDGPLVCILRILSANDVATAKGAAHAFVEAKLGVKPTSPFFYELVEEAACDEILARACRDPDEPERPLFDAQLLRDNTTVNQRAQALALYRDYALEVDPEGETLSVELEEQIEDLVKKKDKTLLKRIDSPTLKSWLLGSVNRLSISLTGSSGTTP